MQPSMNLTFEDNSGEKSTVRFPIVDVTTANIETMKAQSFFTTVQTIAKAIADVSLCTPIKSQISLDPALYPDTRPESMYAQRELGLLVELQDEVTAKRSHFTIPGVDWEAVGLVDRACDSGGIVCSVRRRQCRHRHRRASRWAQPVIVFS
jgi:hypothetical protein